MVVASTIHPHHFPSGWSAIVGGPITCTASDDPHSPGEGGAPTGQAGPEGAPWQLRILIIEDNRDFADNLQTLLELLGHHATVAYTGTEGVEAAVRELPHLVVSDIGLPGLTGFEIARALRANPVTAAAYLVAVTGYGSPADQKQALACGFDAYFVKPVAAADILKVVQTPRHENVD